MFSLDELRSAQLHRGFSFTKGVPVLQTLHTDKAPFHLHMGPGIQQDCKTALFNVKRDPNQMHPVDDPDVEDRMLGLLLELLLRNEAPVEVYDRLGIAAERLIPSGEHLNTIVG